MALSRPTGVGKMGPVCPQPRKSLLLNDLPSG